MYALADLEGQLINKLFKGELHNLRIMEGERPQKAEMFGAKPRELRLFNQRVNIPRVIEINTPVRIGVGIALLVDTDSLYWAPSDSDLMAKVYQKVGEWRKPGLVGPFRDLRAPGTWLCQDVCAGALECPNLILGALLEMLEIGFHRKDGWARYILPDNFRQYQSEIGREQKKLWQTIYPYLPCKYEIQIEFIGGKDKDNLNGHQCILSTEPEIGSLEVIFLAQAELIGRDWLLRDMEKPPRRMQVTCPRNGKPPVKFGFTTEGLDPNADIVVLEGENLNLAVNQKVISVLETLWI